jgi:hypothetical protein
MKSLRHSQGPGDLLFPSVALAQEPPKFSASNL